MKTSQIILAGLVGSMIYFDFRYFFLNLWDKKRLSYFFLLVFEKNLEVFFRVIEYAFIPFQNVLRSSV